MVVSEITQRDREALRAEDLTEAELKAIAAAEVPAEYAHLDTELGAVTEAAGEKAAMVAAGKVLDVLTRQGQTKRSSHPSPPLRVRHFGRASDSPVGEHERIAEILDTLEMGGVAGH